MTEKSLKQAIINQNSMTLRWVTDKNLTVISREKALSKIYRSKIVECMVLLRIQIFIIGIIELVKIIKNERNCFSLARKCAAKKMNADFVLQKKGTVSVLCPCEERSWDNIESATESKKLDWALKKPKKWSFLKGKFFFDTFVMMVQGFLRTDGTWCLDCKWDNS